MTANDERYLAADAVSRLARKKRRQQLWGWILTLFFTLSVILSLTEKENRTIIEGLPIYLVCLAASAFLLCRGYVSAALLSQAMRFGACFAQDRDGTVRAGELERFTGQTTERTRKQLKRLFRLGVFRGCTLQEGGELCVVLSDARIEPGSAGFVTVRCERCGGSSRIRADAVGVCEYCGSPLRAE